MAHTLAHTHWHTWFFPRRAPTRKKTIPIQRARRTVVAVREVPRVDVPVHLDGSRAAGAFGQRRPGAAERPAWAAKDAFLQANFSRCVQTLFDI